MIFQRVNRTNAERVFVVFKANDASIGADDAVQLELTAASVDGVNIVEPNDDETNAVVGIADAAIANGAYGLVQVYGYRSTSFLNLSGNTVALGAPLSVSGGNGYLRAIDFNPDILSDSGTISPFVALETKVAVSTTVTSTMKIFIRCM